MAPTLAKAAFLNLSRNAAQTPPNWLEETVAKAEQKTGVGILVIAGNELPSQFNLSRKGRIVSSRRRDYLEERIRSKFGKQPFAWRDLHDMADNNTAALYTNRRYDPSHCGPFGQHMVKRPVEQAVIFIEHNQFDAQDEQAASFRLKHSDIRPAPEVSIQRNSLKHELGHLGLRVVANNSFSRKQDELMADHEMLRGASPAEVAYAHDWRLLGGLYSSVANYELPYYNALSLQCAPHTPRDAHREIAGMLEVKDKVHQLVTGQPSQHSPNRAHPADYINTCLYGHEGAAMRRFYTPDMPPARAMAIATATQHLENTRFALPEAAEMAALLPMAAQRRIHVQNSPLRP